MAVDAFSTIYPQTHLPERTLEDLAFGRLGEPELAGAEEHLFLCEICRIALEEEQELMNTMRTALKRSLLQQSRSKNQSSQKEAFQDLDFQFLLSPSLKFLTKKR